jgi:hypothetical protein
MPSDEQYLAEAGLDAETGEAKKADATASEQPQPEAVPTAKDVEMFEVQGAKYPVDTKFKLTHGGKVLDVPYSTLANTYRQWQHMQDKWTSEYKPKIDEFQKLRPEFDKYKGFYDKYGQLQTWSEQNPQDWDVLWNLYQNKDKHLLDAKTAGGQPAPGNPNLQPITENLSKLQKELEDLRGFKTQFEQKQQEEAQRKDTEAVMAEVKQFKESYPELNLDERDPDGVSLWGKVIQYGIENKLPTFKAAANLYLEERLRDIWSTRSRTETVKSFQADNKAGVIKRSATPIRGEGAKPNVKQLSYAELADMAKNGAFQDAAGQQ